MHTSSPVCFVLFACAAVALSASVIARRGHDPTVPQTKQTRYGIKGGNYTTIKNYPHTVAIYLNDSHVGGGTILGRRWILISAFEIAGNMYNYNLTIRAGSDKAESGGQTVYTSKIFVHPKYIHGYGFDVALIKTTKKIKFSKKAKPIRIAKRSPKAGCKAVVTGWGLQDYGGEPSQQLKAAVVEIKSRKECKANQTDLNIKQSFCADAPGVDPCIYDSGDPLVCNNVLVGYYQGGDLCGIFQNLDIYANVAIYRTWIIQTMRKNSVEESGYVDEENDFDGHDKSIMLTKNESDCGSDY